MEFKKSKFSDDQLKTCLFQVKPSKIVRISKIMVPILIVCILFLCILCSDFTNNGQGESRSASMVETSQVGLKQAQQQIKDTKNLIELFLYQTVKDHLSLLSQFANQIPTTFKTLTNFIRSNRSEFRTFLHHLYFRGSIESKISKKIIDLIFELSYFTIGVLYNVDCTNLEQETLFLEKSKEPHYQQEISNILNNDSAEVLELIENSKKTQEQDRKAVEDYFETLNRVQISSFIVLFPLYLEEGIVQIKASIEDELKFHLKDFLFSKLEEMCPLYKLQEIIRARIEIQNFFEKLEVFSPVNGRVDMKIESIEEEFKEYKGEDKKHGWVEGVKKKVKNTESEKVKGEIYSWVELNQMVSDLRLKEIIAKFDSVYKEYLRIRKEAGKEQIKEECIFDKKALLEEITNFLMMKLGDYEPVVWNK